VIASALPVVGQRLPIAQPGHVPYLGDLEHLEPEKLSPIKIWIGTRKP